MRLMVRREYSPLTASKPRPMATSGIRKPSSAAKDGRGGCALVNRRRKTKGSEPEPPEALRTAPYKDAAAVSTTSHSSTRMRELDRWSDSSLMATAPMPCQGEPVRLVSRGMAYLLVGRLVLEVAVVDGVQAGRLGRQAKQLAAGRDDRARDRRAHVAVGAQAVGVPARGLDASHAFD